MKYERPTEEEDRAIAAGIDADPDAARELDDAFFAKAERSVGGRPKLESPKVRVNIRLDADLVDSLRESGPGWQTRVNAALRRYVARTPLGDRGRQADQEKLRRRS